MDISERTISVDCTVVGRQTKFGFRHDPKVLAFVTRAHGRMTVEGCAAECLRRFGHRAPSKSAIGRYWLWLDRQLEIGKAA